MESDSPSGYKTAFSVTHLFHDYSSSSQKESHFVEWKLKGINSTCSQILQNANVEMKRRRKEGTSLENAQSGSEENERVTW